MTDDLDDDEVDIEPFNREDPTLEEMIGIQKWIASAIVDVTIQLNVMLAEAAKSATVVHKGSKKQAAEYLEAIKGARYLRKWLLSHMKHVNLQVAQLSEYEFTEPPFDVDAGKPN